jgi:tetratricopeptide (TPR) repeat protein
MSTSLYRYLLLSTFMILMVPILYAQEWTPHKIDTLIKNEIPRLRNAGKISEALDLSQEILENAVKIDYEQGTKDIYFVVANILAVIGKTKESIEYLDHLSSLLSEEKDYVLLGRVYTEYGRNYQDLGLFQQAVIHFGKAKELSEKKWEDETVRLKFLDYLFANEAFFYEEKSDTAAFFNSIKNAYHSRPTPIVASRFAKYYTAYRQNLDSAAYYLGLADSLYATGKFDIHQQSIVLRNWGRYWAAAKQFKKAYAAYTQSVAISEAGGKRNDAKETYKLMHEAYALEGDLDNSNKYFARYTAINDSIQRAQKLLIEIPVNKIIQKHKDASYKRTRQLYTISIVLAILIGITWYYTHKTLQRKKKEKEEEANLLSKQVHESNQKLSEKQQETEHLYEEVSKSVIELEKKEQETLVLQQKVNESFNELIQLGRENHPNFYARFRELYPELHHKLLQISPDLRLSELTLCAYIYLDFSSKDISDYTFKSVRTIQTRKSDLRKKLGISSIADIYVWMKDLLKD